MRIIALRSLREFWQRYPDAERPLRAWHDEVSRANWQTPADIKVQFRHASILSRRRVVFNIKGNQYRLIVAVAYNTGVVFVKFIGPHAQYDAIDAETVEWRSLS
jgi:mRNA interferase HigB